MTEPPKTEKEAKRQQAREAAQAALDKHEQEQARWLSMSEVGRILRLSPSQVVRAKKEGKLPVKRLDVTTTEGLREFVSQYVITDKNGKPRITPGQ